MNTDSIFRLCNKHQWFTGGSNSQYDKMFDMIMANAPIHDIALAIWICSKDETVENIENIIRQDDFDYMRMCGNEMRNRRFECFCNIVPEIVSNIKCRANGAEHDMIDEWWAWVRKTKGLGVSEQDFCNMVDIEMPELAERCAAEVEDEIYYAYLEGSLR